MGFRGKQVKFELVSADATTAVALSMFDSDSNALTLGPRQVLSMQSITATSAVAQSSLIVFDDKANIGVVDAGERMWETTLAAAGSHHAEFGGEGQFGGFGRMPKVIAAAAGAVRVTGMGYLIDS